MAAALSRASEHPITVVSAPAGFGKSTALRQFLDGVDAPSLRFQARPEHRDLASFSRALAAAARGVPPSLRKALERPRPSNGARRRAETENTFWGYVAVDDLHYALDDAGVIDFLESVSEAAGRAIRWIFATRESARLPVATWMAYGKAGPIVDERVLAFTPAETRAAAIAFGESWSARAEDLHRLTQGWPVGVALALRTSLDDAGAQAFSSAAREMMYRFMAEQIYETLSYDARDLLEFSSALPAMDVRLLQAAGFDRALEICERLRWQTAFVFEETPGIYRCHDLFAQFVRRQVALAGLDRYVEVHARAAQVLESAGDVERALSAWIEAGRLDELVRLLERSGSTLIERARADAVGKALKQLDARTRRENPRILALRGLVEAAGGRTGRADSLLRSAVERAQRNDDRELVASVTLKLALIVANERKDPTQLLSSIAEDPRQAADARGEALSLLAADRGLAGELAIAQSAVERTLQLMPDVEVEATRARILQRLGVAELYTGEPEKARDLLIQAAELASELELHSLASRAYAALSTTMSQHFDDADAQLQYAREAAYAASNGANAFDLESATMILLSIEHRCGNSDAYERLERQIMDMQGGSGSRSHILAAMRAERCAWQGKFEEANRLLSKSWDRLPHAFDRALFGAQYAAYLALEGHRNESLTVIDGLAGVLKSADVASTYQRRIVGLAYLYCGVAEIANGRISRAIRTLHSRKLSKSDSVLRALRKVGDFMVFASRCGGASDKTQYEEARVKARDSGYGGIFCALDAILPRLFPRTTAAMLTKVERAVLESLARGFSAKDIALARGNSVNTVRVHIARIIAKLGCRGQIEAIAAARTLRVIE
ncbi:MAG TPA: LuxR C-terminal-related transcriptional regulator [Candidatus Acidoferrales bacterium]|nr:LuxR C-terminal-related transcriptional regulator [Candidatus Acidoferrales bacterium]